MSSLSNRIKEISDLCDGEHSITEEERQFLHHAYWHGDKADISGVLELMCYDPDASDLPILLDAVSPGTWWVHRCDAAQALGELGEEGGQVLKIMIGRETHPVVRFWIMRELIDQEDESCLPFLDGKIPPTSSPYQRSLWIYGNFERENLSSEEALRYGEKLFNHPNRRHRWLQDHIQSVLDGTEEQG